MTIKYFYLITQSDLCPQLEGGRLRFDDVGDAGVVADGNDWLLTEDGDDAVGFERILIGDRVLDGGGVLVGDGTRRGGGVPRTADGKLSVDGVFSSVDGFFRGSANTPDDLDRVGTISIVSEVGVSLLLFLGGEFRLFLIQKMTMQPMMIKKITVIGTMIKIKFVPRRF